MGGVTLRPRGSNEPPDLAQTKFLYIKFLKFLYIKFLKFCHFDLIKYKFEHPNLKFCLIPIEISLKFEYNHLNFNFTTQ